MEIFDVLDSFTKDKTENPFNNLEFDKMYNPYLINRWVSTTEVFLPLVNLINRYDNIPKENHYEYLKNTLPQRKFYFRFPKLKKDINNKTKNNIIKYFECGQEDFEVIINTLSDDIIEIINSKYKI